MLKEGSIYARANVRSIFDRFYDSKFLIFEVLEIVATGVYRCSHILNHGQHQYMNKKFILDNSHTVDNRLIKQSVEITQEQMALYKAVYG
jgi:hypothetical protein